MATKIVERLEADGVITMTQTNVKGVKSLKNGRKLAELEVDGQYKAIEVDTVLVAIGRDPNPKSLRTDLAGVQIDLKTGKIFGRKDEIERTNIKHIYVVGDIVEKVPELQPVA